MITVARLFSLGNQDYHGTAGQYQVNFDQSLIELIHETKWLRRMGLDIPEAAMVLLQQETKYRNYYDTLTELLLASVFILQLRWALPC